MSILQHFQHLQLSADQRTALGEIERFLRGSGGVFMLKGYAGTGKTTLLQGVCRYLASRQQDYRLLAPTGRAAMVLSQKTGEQASTIHRGIYNMKELLEKREGTSFRLHYGLKANQESTRCVYLVDEASMVSDVYSDDEFFIFGSGCLLKDLFTYAGSGSADRKIIFVGDDAQLPPVDMKFSPALDADYLSSQYQVACQETVLSEVIRQVRDSGILDTATRIRQAIASNTFNTFEVNYDSGDTLRLTPADFLAQYAAAAGTDGGIQRKIVITHANRQALEYNRQIRRLRFGDRAGQVQREDWLIITRNNYNGPVELFNGMFVRVLEVGDIVHDARPRFTVEGGGTVERRLRFRDVLVEASDSNGKPYPLRTTLLDDFLTAEEGKLHPFDQRALYIEFKERMRTKGIKPETEAFREALKTDRYFNALQAKYGYAITCHKSQGGEWEIAFVDFNVFIGKMSRSFFRWAYTAITRGSRQLLCIDAPHYNALNQFVVRDIERLAKVLPDAYYVPKREGEPDYFLRYRRERISERCADEGMEVSFRTHNYQLLTEFRQDGQSGRVQLWHNDRGFTKTSYVQFSDDAFQSRVKALLTATLLPEEVPFQEKFEFQRGMHQYFLGLLGETDIRLTNILQHQWSDQYFLYTGAECALVEFHFNGRNFYTHATPRSTDGTGDAKLQTLVDRLRGL